MKIGNWQRTLAVLAVAGLAWSGTKAVAQDSSASSTTQPEAVSAPALQLADGVAQILKLEQAKVGDDTIIAYINNSGNNYALNANQIIYLKHQGVSENVINAMLKQHYTSAAQTQVVIPANSQACYTNIYTIARSPRAAANSPNTQTNYAIVQPVTTIYQPVRTYYYPYYYPYYGYYGPPVALSFGFGWRGGWHH